MLSEYLWKQSNNKMLMGKRWGRWTDATSLCITGFTRFLSHRCFQLESFLMSTRIPATIFFSLLHFSSCFSSHFGKGTPRNRRLEIWKLPKNTGEGGQRSADAGWKILKVVKEKLCRIWTHCANANETFCPSKKTSSRHNTEMDVSIACRYCLSKCMILIYMINKSI